MGSLCQKNTSENEIELDISRSKKETKGNTETGIELENQFTKLLEKVFMPEGPLKGLQSQLLPFEFDSFIDCTLLTIVESNELNDGEKYYGFW